MANPSGRWLLGIASALALAACPGPLPGDPDGGQPDAGDDAGDDAGNPDGGGPWPAGALEVGVPASDADPTFTAMPASLELYRGPQGGFHLLGLYRVGGNRAAPGASFALEVKRTRDGRVVSAGTRSANVAPGSDGSWTTDPAVIVFLCPAQPGGGVDGEELSLTVTATSAKGAALGAASAKTVVHCPSSASDCVSSCGG